MIVLLPLLALLPPIQAPDTARPIALIGASVIPMTDERVLADQTILIEHGRITAVGPRKSVRVPRNANRVEVAGAFVMPGLTDVHVHLEGTPERWMLPIFVAHGVTTVFNLRGSPEQLALRDRVRSGEVLGPAIYTTGPYTNEPAVKTPEDARQAVERQKQAGYDFVKIHGNLSREAHAALTAAGREFHIPVIGHAPRNLPFESVLEVHQTMVAHAEELIYTHFTTRDTSGLAEMAKKMVDAGVWLTPNLAMFHGIATQWGRATGADSSLGLAEGAYLNARGYRFWTTENPYTKRDPAGAPTIEANYRFLVRLTGTFARAGVKLLAGTDTPLPLMYPGHSLHDELDELVGAGLSRYEALVTATRNPASFITQFVDSTYLGGVVTVGARADLLVLSGNPLTTLSAARRPTGVVLGGHWLGRETLEKMRADVMEANRRDRAATPGQ